MSTYHAKLEGLAEGGDEWVGKERRKKSRKHEKTCREYRCRVDWMKKNLRRTFDIGLKIFLYNMDI